MNTTQKKTVRKIRVVVSDVFEITENEVRDYFGTPDNEPVTQEMIDEYSAGAVEALRNSPYAFVKREVKASVVEE